MAKTARPMGFLPYNEVVTGRWQDSKRGLVALPDKYLAHTITDPPYSEYVHRNKMSGSNETSDTAVSTPVTFKPITLDELKQVAKEIVRTTRGWALVFCADDDIANWRDAFTSAGALRWPGLIWTKPNGTPQFRGEGPSQPCEHIVTTWCGEGRPEWNGGGKQGHYSVSIESRDRRVHETQKPKRLMEHLVLDFTEPGALIGDPYCGAGTTGVAAKACGRNYVLWDEQLKHTKSALRLLERTKEQLRLEFQYQARDSAFGIERTPRVKPEQLPLLQDGAT